MAPNMALQRTRRPRFRSGRSLRSLGSPLNAPPLCVGKFRSSQSACSTPCAPGQSRGRTDVARKTRNHQGGVRTRFEAHRAGEAVGGHEFAAA
jgi:hypothetical protein